MTDAPKAYYRLDESGPAMYDATTNRLNGSYGSGITKRVAGLVSTEGDPAASFPGGTSSSSTMATVPASSLLQPTSGVSIEAFVSETKAATAVTDIVSYGGTTDSTIAYSLRISATNTFAAHFQTSAGALDVSTTTTVTPGTVYHVTVAFASNLARIYVGDTVAGSATPSGGLVYGGTTDRWRSGQRKNRIRRHDRRGFRLRFHPQLDAGRQSLPSRRRLLGQRGTEAFAELEVCL